MAEFINIEGIKTNSKDIVQSMINYYKEAYSEGTTQINDFNEGSEIRNLLESVSLEVYELRFLIDHMVRMGYPQYAVGGFLDVVGKQYNVYRDEPVHSTGKVTFSLSEVLGFDLEIVEGTVVSTSIDYFEFQTIESVTIPAGEDNVLVNIEALDSGVDGNVQANMINYINEPILDVLSVNNAEATSGGKDGESDDSFRERIRSNVDGQNIGTTGWFKGLAMSVEGVHDVYVINNPQNQDYTVELLVNGVVKPTSNSILDEVEYTLNRDDNKIVGLRVLVSKPEYVEVNVGLDFSVQEGYNVYDVVNTVMEDLTCYFDGGVTSNNINYPGLGIGDDVIKSQLQLIIANNPGVLDYNLQFPQVNVEVVDDKASKLGRIDVTQIT